jgi:hypothetical protein
VQPSCTCPSALERPVGSEIVSPLFRFKIRSNIFCVSTLSYMYGTLSQKKCCLTGVGRAVASSTGQVLVCSIWSSDCEISRCSWDCDGKCELGRDSVCERFWRTAAAFSGTRSVLSSQPASLAPSSPLSPSSAPATHVARPLLITLRPGTPCLTRVATMLVTMLLLVYDDTPANAHK